MSTADDSAEPEYDVQAVQQWRQGDYSTTIPSFLVSDEVEDGVLSASLDENVIGLVVISQTCDIVNVASGKGYVIVCPLIELNEKSLHEVIKGRTPSATTLQHPPTAASVVDLNRMMSLHKSVLAGMTRSQGFSSDRERTLFTDALQRKHGRFAFPDSFSEKILSKLRDRILSAHQKSESKHGKAYRSIRTMRVAAYPNWDAANVRVRFFVILEQEDNREATREDITSTLKEHFGKLNWPTGFSADAPLFDLFVIQDMTAADWIDSQPIDWDFVSSLGRRYVAQPKEGS